MSVHGERPVSVAQTEGQNPGILSSSSVRAKAPIYPELGPRTALEGGDPFSALSETPP